MKKLLLFLIALLFAATSPWAATPVTTAAKMIVTSPSTVTVPITVTNFNNIGAFNLTLDYDPAILSFTGLTVVTGFVTPEVNTPSGRLRFASIASSGGVTLFDGTALANITFSVISSGTSKLIFIDENNGSFNDCEYSDYTTGNPYVDTPIENFYINGWVSNLAVTLSPNNPTCASAPLFDDGSINATVTGGKVPYTYAWSNGPTTEDISGLTAGTYTITVTDNFGVVVTASATLVNPATPVHNTSNDTWYCTIQDAILALSTESGHTITIAPGTFVETGQIIITENLNIIGSGNTVTIIKPNTSHTAASSGWFYVNSGITLNLSNVCLDGTGYNIENAIYHEGSGTIDDCRFTEIKNPWSYPPTGAIHAGTAVKIVSTGNVDVTDCIFTQIGRNGIRAQQCTGTYSGNNYTGKGAGDWMDYFILSEYGDNVVISGNTVINCTGVALSDGSGSCAIAIWDDPNTTAIVIGNILTDNSQGIVVVGINGSDFSYTWPHVTIGAGNIITGGEYGIAIESYTPYTPQITFGASTVKGQTVAGMSISDNASFGTTYNISSIIYKNALDNVITDNFAKEDLTIHAIDAGNRGLFVWNPSNVYVTTNSFVTPTTTTASIQRGIDAASPNWTVNVGPGTFNSMDISKPLSVIGQGIGVTFDDHSTDPIGGDVVKIHGLTGDVLLTGFTLKTGPATTVSSTGINVYGMTGPGTITINYNEIWCVQSASGTPMDNMGIYAHSSTPTGGKLVFDHNNVHGGGGAGSAHCNPILIEAWMGSTEITNNTIDHGIYNNGASDVIVFLNADYGNVTEKQLISGNTLDMGWGTTYDPSHRGAGITFWSGYDGNGVSTSAAGYTDVEISNNTLFNLKTSRRGISLYNSSGGDGSGGNITDAIISGNTISNAIGYSGEFGIRVRGKATGTQITNNLISGVNDAVLIAPQYGHEPISTSVNDNSLLATTYGIRNTTTATIAGTCNWFGTVGTGAIAALISGPVTWSPYLVLGTDNEPGTTGFQPVPGSCGTVTDLYVNDDVYTSGTERWTLAVGNDANPGTALLPFRTINHAISAAGTGNTIWVDAGTYVEDVKVNKLVKIYGSNYDQDPNTVPWTWAESVVQPFTNDAENGALISVEVSNVDLRGLAIDGNNPALTGIYNVGGLDVDVSNGIQNGPTYGTYFQINHLNVENNKFRNFSYDGIYLWLDYNGVSAYNTIHHNYFTNMWEGIQGYAIHADISNNTFYNVNLGLSLHQVKSACPGGTPQIKDNTITIGPANVWSPWRPVRTVGIWVNGRTGDAPPLTVSGNIINMPNAPESGKIIYGLYAMYTGDSRQLTFENNIINGQGNCKAGFFGFGLNSTVTVKGGTWNGITDKGIWVSGNDPLSDWPNPGTPSGILVQDVTINGASTLLYGIYSSEDGSGNPLQSALATVNISTITNCTGAGIMASGAKASVNVYDNTATITGNTVGVEVANSGSASVNTSTITANGTGIHVQSGGKLTSCANNFITSNTTAGVKIESTAGTIGAITNNKLSGNPSGNAINNQLASQVSAECNWYGFTNYAGVTAQITGNVDYISWLISGVDAVLLNQGFQPEAGSCNGTPVVITFTQANVSCYGGNDGAINITVSGGSGTYSYLWTPSGQITQDRTGLVAGTYSVLVTDTYGSTATQSVVITQPAAIPVSGTFKYYNLTPTVMKNVTVELWQGSKVYPVSGEVKTDEDGYYTFPNVCPGTYDVVVTTAKPSGGINSTDAAQVNQWGVGPQYPIEKVRFFAGDVVYDNNLNGGDAGRILQYFVQAGTPGFISSTPRGPWVFWPTAQTISVNSSTDPVIPSITVSAGSITPIPDFYGLCTGDFNRSFTPGPVKSASETLTLNYGKTMQVSPGSEFELPLYAGMDMEVGAVSLIMNFPSADVEITDVFLTSDPSSTLLYNVSGDELRIGWTTLSPIWLNEGESLITLKMKVNEAAGNGSIYFSLAGDPLNELADGDYEVIGNAVLTIDVVKASALGFGENSLAENLTLSNHPNPFNGTTTFVYSIPVDGKVILEIYDLLGNKVKVAVDETQSAGTYSLKLDANQLQPGVYTATIKLKNTATAITRTIKIISK